MELIELDCEICAIGTAMESSPNGSCRMMIWANASTEARVLQVNRTY
ncbi:hypothetical protein VPMS16_3512 [Vibrio sp. 16]|nr:hypothetical protein VPMS16_3512 [Vibrio sp. 16]